MHWRNHAHPGRSLPAAALALPAVLAIFAGTGGCSFLRKISRPLTPEEQAVRVEQPGQEISVRLQETCKPSGKSDRFPSENHARIRAVEQGANTVQILSVYQMNGEDYDYYVRFWKCPGAPATRSPAP